MEIQGKGLDIFRETKIPTLLDDIRPNSQARMETYDERDFTFQNGEVILAGSLILPHGPGPFPAVVMIHGSEPDTRDFIWRTGDGLVFLDAGVVVFAYDKRGTGAGILPGDLQAIVQQAAEGGIWQEASSLLDDLAALHGILAQIRDLGLTLISSTPQGAGVEK